MEQMFVESLGLGLQPKDLNFSQILLRTMVMFFAMLLMMRLAGLRFLAGKTTFDVLLAFIMASMLSRAVNGTAPFFGTIFAGFLVVFLHRLLAFLTFRYHSLGCLLKGEAQPLILDGKVQSEALSRHHISRHDLAEDLRLNASTDDVSRVRVALIERNGEISVQCHHQPPTVTVENEGKTIHIHFPS